MAKKRVSAAPPPAVKQPPLDPDWEDQIPEVVQDAVDTYLRAMRQKNKFSEQTRNAKDKCIEVMKENGIKKLRIDEGKQWLEVEDEPKLRTRKVQIEKDDTRQSARA